MNIILRLEPPLRVTRGFVAIAGAALLINTAWSELMLGFCSETNYRTLGWWAFLKYNTMDVVPELLINPASLRSRNGNYTFMRIQVNSGLSHGLRTMFIFWDRQWLLCFFLKVGALFESYRCHSIAAAKACPCRGHSEHALTLSSAWVPTIRKWPLHLWIASYFMRHWQIWIAFLVRVSICMNCGKGSTPNHIMWHSPRNGTVTWPTWPKQLRGKDEVITLIAR